MAQFLVYVLEPSIRGLILSEDARDELFFDIAVLNGRAIWFSPGITRGALSDASSTGFGGFVVELGPQISHGQWTPDQASCSSTWHGVS